MRIVFLLLAVIALSVGLADAVIPSIRAQNVPGESQRPGVRLTAEERHIVKENVLTSPDLKRETGQFELSVGAALPAGIAVREFPPLVREKVPQVRSLRFFVKDNNVAIVDPRDNTIADVIE